MEERTLILRAQEGDREAFGGLVRLHQARLRAYAARFIDRRDDVYDLVQDAFLDALRNLDSFDPSSEFAPWLRGICKNRILNHFRSRQVRRTASLALVDAAVAERIESDRAPDGGTVDRLEAIKRCVGELQESQRRILELRYGNGQPVSKIAAALDRSAASLSMALLRIRGVVAKCVQRRLEEAVS